MKILDVTINALKGVVNILEKVNGGKQENENTNQQETKENIDTAKQQLLVKFQEKISETIPYAQMADDSYRALKYNNLEVPALDLYDGEYYEQLQIVNDGVQMEIENATERSELESIEIRYKSEVVDIATQVQTYLREDTSDIDAAMLWDSENKKAIVEHIAPHAPKEFMPDDPIMSEVMEAFRKYSEVGAAGIIQYGSQNLINAVYEAVEEGQDAFSYIDKIMELQSQAFGGVESLNENSTISVPNAGSFGELLF